MGKNKRNTARVKLGLTIDDLINRTEKKLKTKSFDEVWEEMTNPKKNKSTVNFKKSKHILMKNLNM